MNQQDPKNPRMADMFRTALAAVTPPPRHDAPNITVTGSNNVISLGGTVYLHHPPAAPRDSESEGRV